jgi:hypothetical protein
MRHERPDSRRANAARAEGGAAKEFKSEDEHRKYSLASGRLQSWSDLDSFTDRLTIVADWRNELRLRIARARLKLDLLALEDGEFNGLVAEAEGFKAVCQALGRSSSPKRRTV